MALTSVVADTDVVIDFLRGRGPGADVVDQLVRTGTLLVTAITSYELTAGAITARQRRQAIAFCDRRTLALSAGAALEAGRIGAELRSAGTGIGAADTLIAGICRHRSLALVTNNVRHFSRVPGLELNPMP